MTSSEEYLQHFERYLGAMDGSWARDEGEAHMQVLRFSHPASKRVTFTTFGLNQFELALPSGRPLRQELVFATRSGFEDYPVPGLLNTVGEDMIHSGNALTRGQLIGPRGPLFPDSELTSFYCAEPIYFPDDFAEYRDTQPLTLMVWLVPITDQEAGYLAHHGSDAFEDVLEQADPDLLDLQRPGLPLPHDA